MKTLIKIPIPSLLIALTSVIGLLPMARAVSPPPDGGYPGGNTAEGQAALLSRTTGGFNTAIGFLSLRSNTTGSFNTAVGAGALLANIGTQNTATGAGALLSNTGDSNTANGAFALFSNTTGTQNTAHGGNALMSNTIASDNTATGFDALANNTTGGINTAIGSAALFSNTTGNDNTANGDGALADNTTGSGNTALGVLAGSNVTTADNVICIGASGANVDNSCFIINIRDTTTVNNDAIPVLIDSSDQLGTASCSRRYKTDIKAMGKASECVLGLKPVSFRYKVHKGTTPQFGLIAEEVAEVNPNLVIYDADGNPYTVRYDAVNAMLLNEFLKEHRHVQEQDAIIARQQKQIDALNAGLQKVSTQLEVNNPAPQTVANNQ